MEIVNTLDIDGTQWEITDNQARQDIAYLKLECNEKANKSEIPTKVEQLTDSSSYAKKTDIPDVAGLEQSIEEMNVNLLNKISFIPSNAYDNGTLIDALLVDLYDKNGIQNKPQLVLRGTTNINMPSDCAWGVREVFYYSSNVQEKRFYIIARLTGCDTDNKPALWQNLYNSDKWYGWTRI